MRWINANRTLQTQRLLAVCGALALSACASKYAQVPPRLQLESYGRVALVTFSNENTSRELAALASQKFAEEVLASQSGIELLEIDPSDPAIAGVGTDATALASALAKKKDVAAVFVGQLKLSDVKPSGRLGASGDIQMGAGFSAELSVRLLSTRTGGTVWRSSAARNGSLGQVAMAGGLPSVSVRDPQEAYGDAVYEMVAQVTRDLRPTWVKQ